MALGTHGLGLFSNKEAVLTSLNITQQAFKTTVERPNIKSIAT
jgi:hypothetical protein